ncbi:MULTISPECIES: pyridoxamine 5'-phosphate oxidase family protein [Thermoactinomyces]|uniref:Pyridoxamine 5'-phosphate oxidase family protein n=1 Tax=Thermoactinomyces daqus TaxID=1329516 RepID=A0A7W1XD69_9BACL|nr:MULTISPECIES: pyridoxamine 5'-phosphate oxidase family protein [Thermoactinomyces]MBA4544519.1 pyridoxamine 5'-phosphate oxidase family protein [Thermoactinomyces daqus]MBH8596766.1 pyridoxamine 5'-phosphate oxidase family protein [Thermoactinomyces sp. CICC 10523]MBH8603527.1 pyridoxamine 5'-phosphate oxidase family protein [Thermoactinomyces sp. CICC 10522]MBH8606691.1 pyridoxamine 5'-phosphate oxidase family protein [Thermoactinomyces sp. CICC 10521]
MENQRISEELCQLFNGRSLEEKQHEAMMLLTVTEDLWPHIAMVSVGEILALDRTHLRLALWPGTTTTANILRTGKATLVVFFAGKAHYVRLSLKRLPELPGARHKRERFAASVVSAREDVAKYAEIRSGVTIDLKDPDAVLTRWSETLEELAK